MYFIVLNCLYSNEFVNILRISNKSINPENVKRREIYLTFWNIDLARFCYLKAEKKFVIKNYNVTSSKSL